jgi:hypothetical protein
MHHLRFAYLSIFWPLIVITLLTYFSADVPAPLCDNTRFVPTFHVDERGNINGLSAVGGRVGSLSEIQRMRS